MRFRPDSEYSAGRYSRFSHAKVELRLMRFRIRMITPLLTGQLHMWKHLQGRDYDTPEDGSTARAEINKSDLIADKDT